MYTETLKVKVLLLGGTLFTHI